MKWEDALLEIINMTLRRKLGGAVGDPWQIPEKYFLFVGTKVSWEWYLHAGILCNGILGSNWKKDMCVVAVLVFRHWSPAVQPPDPCLASSVSVAFHLLHFFLPKSYVSTLMTARAYMCWMHGPNLSLNQIYTWDILCPSGITNNFARYFLTVPNHPWMEWAHPSIHQSWPLSPKTSGSQRKIAEARELPV